MKLVIKNERHGFATNSSSSHSIVIDAKTKAPTGGSTWSRDFNWDNFQLITQEEKRIYIYYLFRHCLAGCSYDYEISGYKDVPELRKALGLKEKCNGGIDHGSIPNILFDNTPDTMAFFKELGKFIIESGTVIYGGNDNEEENEHDRPYMSDLFWHLCGVSDCFSPTRIKVKKDNDDFILFVRECGLKKRVKFVEDNEPMVDQETKASFPELVDIKITDYCDKDCAFCYQGSSKAGMPADVHDIFYTIDTLKGLGTFEIAIGGGEPTSHPRLYEIVDKCAESDISVAITTNDLNFLEKHNILKCDSIKYDSIKDRFDWVSKLSGIGISAGVRNIYGFWRFYSRVNPHIKNKLVMHYVAANWLLNMKDLTQALVENYNVLLLGPKKPANTKEKIKPLNSSEKKELISIIKFAKEHSCGRVGVDTAFVATYPDILEALDVKKHLYIKSEGKTSCYVDCVNKFVSKSSYDTEKRYDLNYSDYTSQESRAKSFSEIFKKL